MRFASQNISWTNVLGKDDNFKARLPLTPNQEILRDHVWNLTMASLSPLQSNAARTELQWTFYLAHYCGHMLQLCCRAFSFQYYRGQTGCDWLPLPKPPDYILGLEPGIMKSVAPTGTGPAAYSWTLKAEAEGSGINSAGCTLCKCVI